MAATNFHLVQPMVKAVETVGEKPKIPNPWKKHQRKPIRREGV